MQNERAANAKKAHAPKRRGLLQLAADNSVGLNLLRNEFVFKEEIVQRAERTVLFHLINGHFVAVYRQFDEAAPAVKLMGADFSDIPGIAVGTLHCQIHHPVPYNKMLAHPHACKQVFLPYGLPAGWQVRTVMASSPRTAPGGTGILRLPSCKSVRIPSDSSRLTIESSIFSEK